MITERETERAERGLRTGERGGVQERRGPRVAERTQSQSEPNRT